MSMLKPLGFNHLLKYEVEILIGKNHFDLLFTIALMKTEQGTWLIIENKQGINPVQVFKKWENAYAREGEPRRQTL